MAKSGFKENLYDPKGRHKVRESIAKMGERVDSESARLLDSLENAILNIGNFISGEKADLLTKEATALKIEVRQTEEAGFGDLKRKVDDFVGRVSLAMRGVDDLESVASAEPPQAVAEKTTEHEPIETDDEEVRDKDDRRKTLTDQRKAKKAVIGDGFKSQRLNDRATQKKEASIIPGVEFTGTKPVFTKQEIAPSAVVAAEPTPTPNPPENLPVAPVEEKQATLPESPRVLEEKKAPLQESKADKVYQVNVELREKEAAESWAQEEENKALAAKIRETVKIFLDPNQGVDAAEEYWSKTGLNFEALKRDGSGNTVPYIFLSSLGLKKPEQKHGLLAVLHRGSTRFLKTEREKVIATKEEARTKKLREMQKIKEELNREMTVEEAERWAVTKASERLPEHADELKIEWDTRKKPEEKILSGAFWRARLLNIQDHRSPNKKEIDQFSKIALAEKQKFLDKKKLTTKVEKTAPEPDPVAETSAQTAAEEARVAEEAERLKEKEKFKNFESGVISEKKEKDGYLYNQDCYVVGHEDGLYAVCDGVGGHSAGDVASRRVGEMLQEKVDKLNVNLNLAGTQSAITEILKEINGQIVIEGQHHLEPGKKAMGTTVSVLKFVFDGADLKAVAAHCGDSRTYRCRQNVLEQIGFDHNNLRKEYENDWKKFVEFQTAVDEVQSQDQLGELNDELQNEFLNRSGIDSYLGDPDSVKIDVQIVNVEQGDYFILTSDGIHDNLTKKEIEQILAENQNKSAEDVAKALVTAAQKASRQTGDEFPRAKPDDMTAVVVYPFGKPSVKEADLNWDPPETTETVEENKETTEEDPIILEDDETPEIPPTSEAVLDAEDESDRREREWEPAEATESSDENEERETAEPPAQPARDVLPPPPPPPPIETDSLTPEVDVDPTPEPPPLVENAPEESEQEKVSADWGRVGRQLYDFRNNFFENRNITENMRILLKKHCAIFFDFEALYQDSPYMRQRNGGFVDIKAAKRILAVVENNVLAIEMEASEFLRKRGVTIATIPSATRSASRRHDVH